LCCSLARSTTLTIRLCNSVPTVDSTGRAYDGGIVDTLRRVVADGRRPALEAADAGRYYGTGAKKAADVARALFAGVTPRVTWIGVGGFIFFGAYETAKTRLNIAVDHGSADALDVGETVL
jgi:hypothetical protein